MAGDIQEWLEGLGLGKYAENFAENEVEFRVLPELTSEDFREMDIPLGPRKLLLKAVAELQIGGVAATGSAEIPSEAMAQGAARTEAGRRQLTLMFCDLVGSTALSAKLDPEDYRGIMRSYQETVVGAVGQYDGHVAKYLGDGVLVYFGWPRAHEDDAERAVRAGLDAVDAVAALTPWGDLKLDARVGIATGLVVAGDLVGEGVIEEGAVSGETPNLAARLQELASPGAVVVAEATLRLLGGVFDCDDLGNHDLKGIAEPMRAWRVIGARATSSRFDASHSGRLTPFVGRDNEIELLVDRWERAKEGEGQVVLLSGEAGIGKSRITRALNERLEGEQPIRLRYQCSPHHQSSALHPFIVQLERAAGFAPRDDATAKLDKIERLLEQGTDDIGGATPFIASLLSVPTGARYAPLNMAAQRQKERTLEVLLDQLMGLAARNPVVMIFEDAHWVDPTTLELLEQTIDRVQDVRVLVVITSRPEFQATWASHTHVTTLTLNRLTRSQCGAMVERVSGGKALPLAVLDQVVAKTDGVPLFVEELTKTVLESGLLTETGGKYELTGPLPPLAIPATLHDSLMARLDRLGAVKEIAQMGAAIGREFPRRLLAAVSHKNDAALDDALAQLVDAGLLFRRGSRLEVRYVFKHALVQDTAYESLLRSNRQQLHLRIAQAYENVLPEIAELEPEILAYHYTEAGAVEPAIDYWRRAGERAAERSGNHEAIVHLERALILINEIPADHDRDGKELDLRLLLGGSQLMAKGHGAPEVEEAYSRALDLCQTAGETTQLVRALFGLWRYHIVVPNYQTCLDLARQLLEHGTRSDDPVARMLGHYSDGFPRMMIGDNQSARKSLDTALEIYHPDQRGSPAYRQGQDPAEACFMYRGLALWLLGYPDAATASAAEGIALAATIADPFTQAHSHTFHAVLDHFRGDHKSLRHNSDEAVRLAKEYGFSLWEVWGEFYSHLLDAETDPNRGIEELRRDMQTFEGIAGKVYRSINHALLAQIYARAGLFDGALDEIGVGLAAVEALNERSWEAELRRLEGAYLLARDNDAEAAESGFQRAIEIATHQRARSLELRAAMSLARLWQTQGKTSEARDLLRPIYGWFTEGFDTPDLKDAKALLDELS